MPRACDNFGGVKGKGLEHTCTASQVALQIRRATEAKRIT